MTKYHSKQRTLEAILLLTVANFYDMTMRREGIAYTVAEFADVRMAEHESNGYEWADPDYKAMFDTFRDNRAANRSTDWSLWGIDVMDNVARDMVARNYNIEDSTESCMAAHLLKKMEQNEERLKEITDAKTN